ncbi:MAG TPA: hypothetical protein VNH11_23700 [Pirellulales bacterium]|nr:hypothetical protein [Pirellulales bacterium]
MFFVACRRRRARPWGALPYLTRLLVHAHFGVALVISAAVPHAMAVEPALKATFTQADIYRAASERARKIKNLRVEYDVSFRQLIELPAHKERPDALALDPYRVLFVMDGERRRLYIEPTAPKAPRGRSHQRPPTTVIFDGEQSIEFSPGSIAMLTPGKNRACEAGELYAEVALGIAITDRDRANYDNAWFYPHCLRPTPFGANAHYRVQADLELVDSAWCHVLLAEGYDKLWVDPNIGFAFRRRELYYGPEDMALVYRDTLSDFVESAGLWVPRRWHRETFAELYNPKEYWNKVYAEASLRVSHIGINEATDDDFRATLPAGSYVLDMATNKTYEVPGDGLDALRDLAKEGRKYLVDEARKDQRGLSAVARGALAVISIVALAVLGVAAYLRGRTRGG